jgi:membrane protease YdiL (CAAX protease family)
LAFQGFVAWWGPKIGYFAGFVFYWVVWGLLFPLWILRSQELLALFRDVYPRLGKPAWLGVVLLALPPLLAGTTVFPVKLPLASWSVILGSAGLALVNGTLEEVLWRGLYVRRFTGRIVLGYLYPALGFAFWHLAPQAVHPITMPGGVAAFIAGALFFGLCWGWVAWRTGSIRWAVVSHVLTDFLGLGATIYLGG